MTVPTQIPAEPQKNVSFPQLPLSQGVVIHLVALLQNYMPVGFWEIALQLLLHLQVLLGTTPRRTIQTQLPLRKTRPLEIPNSAYKNILKWYWNVHYCLLSLCYVPIVAKGLEWNFIETLIQIPTSHPRDPATIELDFIKAEVLRTAHLFQCLWPKQPIKRELYIWNDWSVSITWLVLLNHNHFPSHFWWSLAL